MENLNNIILSQADFQKILSLIQAENSDTTEFLEEEIGRASIVADEDLPNDVVSMNSKVRYQDLETGKETTVDVVFPHEANIEENKISVLAPVGSALIGLRVGQIIQWPVPSGKEKKLKVLSVLAQLESA